MRHNGGIMPVDPDTLVIVRYHNGQCAGASARDGIKATPIPAKERVWNWRTSKKRIPDGWDITEYWLAEDVPAERLVA